MGVIAAAAADKDVPLLGSIDSFGYGYKVKVTINGTVIQVIKGGGQQMTRLFAVNHPLGSQASEAQKDLFILKEGENLIVVEFAKEKDAQNKLEIKLEVPDRYSVPLFHLHSSAIKNAAFEKK